MINFHTAEFIKSASQKEDHLHDLPEILLIGKSNVGKSSLINALTNQKSLAYVSKTPGQTKLVNYYKIDNKFYLVDVPGFGYRRLAYEKDDFEPLMENYFSSNTSLKAVLYLLDSRRDITQDELDVIQYIEDLNYPLLLVFTKSDKCKQKEKAKLIKRIKELNLTKYNFVSIENIRLLENLKATIESYVE